MAPNYQNGKVYMIISDDDNKIYIGSTTKTLIARFGNHKYDFKMYELNGCRNWCTSFNILRKNNAHIILLEQYPCNSKEELNAREYLYYELNKDNCVNSNVPNNVRNFINKKEYMNHYYNLNKIKLLEYSKNTRDEKKEILKLMNISI